LASVTTPDEAIDELLEKVHAEIGALPNDTGADALLRVLAELSIEPGDPAWTDGRDVVGRTYEFAVAGQDRRQLGQYFTPMGLAGSMARWLLDARPSSILDPGCGTGSLLMAVAKQIQASDAKSSVRSMALHGMDIDPQMIEMAEVTARVRQVRNLKVDVSNFLVDDVVVQPDAVICNPPYTRHHSLSGVQKQQIYEGFKDRLGIDLSHLSSLHVLFLVRAIEISGDQARLAFLTPANWLDMNYAESVKEYLLEHAHVTAIVNFPATEIVFDHATTTAAITLIEKGGDPRQPTRILHSRSSRPEDIQMVLDDPNAGIEVRLGSERKWSRPSAKLLAGPRLEEVAHITRGVATGYNEFFVISEAERMQLNISRHHFVPCLPSPRKLGVTTVRSATLDSLPETVPRWLLTPRKPFPSALERYLRSGALEAQNRTLVQQRISAGREWYQVRLGVDAPIVMTYLNKGAPRFLHNQAGAIPLNNWLMIRPRKGVRLNELLDVLRRPSVVSALRSQSRVYGDGLWKVEPRELRNVRLPKGSIDAP
jgi:adenine-specific DNA-methyltransferase